MKSNEMGLSNPMVSIIIRTKNEERWIPSCLRAVFDQSYTNFEVILVDNESEDKTVKRAKEFPVKVISISEFFPGNAINIGIEASFGEYIVCLSGHCIPTNSEWLGKLVEDLADPEVAGVYGRQEPLSFTSDLDKRDLLTVFGLDRVVQYKDSFFHNANSSFRRSMWLEYPFDNFVTNIEDRVWGQQVISAGFKIIYEPEASVLHWHGIHQDLNPNRAKNIVRILEGLDGLIPPRSDAGLADLNIVAIIPVKGKSVSINDKTLLKFTIEAALTSDFISNVVVSTDDEETAALAREHGALTPFIRDAEYSESHVSSLDVMKYSLQKLEETLGVPDLVVGLEETYPFRSPELLDNILRRVVSDGLDTVIAVRSEKRGIWLDKGGDLELVSEGFMPTHLKNEKAVVGYLGLAYVCHPTFIRSGDFFGKRLGVYEVDEPFAGIQIRDKETIDFAGQYLDDWWSKHYVNQQEANCVQKTY